MIAAAAATSWRDRADSFFLILKAKRDFGANFARASWNLSVRLLIDYERIRELWTLQDRSRNRLLCMPVDHMRG